ncbi:MAG: EAL domain-containing protein [Thiovulaceae bacterium]|nr:EAL domain-containing protein [Sulfurimonadaceae bacterium]
MFKKFSTISYELGYEKTAFIIIMFLSIMMIAMMWVISREYYDTLRKDEFQKDVMVNMDLIQKRMINNTYLLQSCVALFDASKSVTRQEWHNFIASQYIEKNYPGIQGIGYSKLMSFSDEMRPRGKQLQYAPVLYIEPMNKRNIMAIGYDVFSEPTRRSAMLSARDSALPAMTDKITLVQEIDEHKQHGMLIYLPIYKKNMKIDTVNERRRAIDGYISGVFRMNDLMEKIVIKRSVVNFEIYDGKNITENHLLYRSFRPSSYISKYHIQEQLLINGRVWHINLSSTKEFDENSDTLYPLLITLAGMTVYFLLLYIIVSLIKSRRLLIQQSFELLKLSQAIEQSPVSIVITNLDGEMEYVNAAFTKNTGYTKEETMGQNPRILQSGKTLPESYEEMWKHISEGQNWQGEFINRRKDGSEYIETVSMSPVFQRDGSISHYIGIKEDITEKKQSQERIQYLANFDSLTGLPNRFQLEKLIDNSIHMAIKEKETFAIIFLDIDHFKDINDTLGHHVGDEILIALSKRFSSLLGAMDIVSRLGGDEFIFLFSKTNPHDVESIVKKLLDSIDESIKLEHHDLRVTASIGIAIYPIDGADSQTLLKHGDTAMFRAKKEGRNRYVFYTKSMQEHSVRNLNLTNALHYALSRQELYLVYQPQILAKDTSLIGMEVLLRWKHPEFGEISPMEFIPLAEESGLILSIGEWVLRSAVLQTKEWIEKYHFPLTVAVNLSAVQFRQPNLAQLISGILEEAQLGAEYLELELTEAVAMNNPQDAINVMNSLHEKGIKMSIDDFGTGYSSLSYLKKFKISKLKIDQSFVRDIFTDHEDRAIVSTIINMAHSLGMLTIAEGVETEEQLHYLQEQKCDEIQGYYYSKPLKKEDFERYISTSCKRF